MSVGTTNLSCFYVDLGTFNDMSAEFYHGEDAGLKFSQCADQWTWFSQGPLDLTLASSVAFGQDARFECSNVPTYITAAWLRVTLPAIAVLGNTNASTVNGANSPFLGAWTRNVGHWLATQHELEINNCAVHTIPAAYLDFYSQFSVPASKRVIYNNMIGNVDELIDPIAAGTFAPGVEANYDYTIASRTLNIPIPLYFTHHDGTSLCRAAMHLSRVMIKSRINTFNNLFNLYACPVNFGGSGSEDGRPLTDAASTGVSGTPALSDGQMYVNAVLTTSDERKLLANCQRKSAVRLLQEQSATSVSAAATSVQVDLDFAHHVSNIFFGIRNTTYNGIRANYTCASPVAEASRINFSPSLATDPVSSAELKYDACSRHNMYADYYSLVQPWYHSLAGPEETGYHMIAYASDIQGPEADGSTDYTQLNRPKLVITTSPQFRTNSAASPTANVAGGLAEQQTFEVVCFADYWTVITQGQGQFGYTVA